jgi:hypothetical protein
LGKRGDAVDRALDVGERLLLVGVDLELGGDVAAALGRRSATDPLDAVDAAHGLLDGEDDAPARPPPGSRRGTAR